jgi:hypothetical protein
VLNNWSGFTHNQYPAQQQTAIEAKSDDEAQEICSKNEQGREYLTCTAY